MEEKINSRPTVSFMKEAVEHATKLISGGLGGYVVMHSSESSKNGYRINARLPTRLSFHIPSTALIVILIFGLKEMRKTRKSW